MVPSTETPQPVKTHTVAGPWVCVGSGTGSPAVIQARKASVDALVASWNDPTAQVRTCAAGEPTCC